MEVINSEFGEDAENFTMFLQFGEIIPVSDLFTIDQYQEFLYCIPGLRCVPYIGCHDDIMQHLAVVDMIPKALISKAN